MAQSLANLNSPYINCWKVVWSLFFLPVGTWKSFFPGLCQWLVFTIDQNRVAPVEKEINSHLPQNAFENWGRLAVSLVSSDLSITLSGAPFMTRTFEKLLISSSPAIEAVAKPWTELWYLFVELKGTSLSLGQSSLKNFQQNIIKLQHAINFFRIRTFSFSNRCGSLCRCPEIYHCWNWWELYSKGVLWDHFFQLFVIQSKVGLNTCD